MRLPNKVTTYTNSIIALFPNILEALEESDMIPKELFEQVSLGKGTMGDFLSALDCLFALGQIEIIEEGRVLHYVKTDSL
ncbi:hypothetical protein MFMK1_000758 [Metallumcola ferriviriculae]|uniref:Uncharacterized protein n=1 Tax=Metallumcola ferriviriculae TaxID=3039180 RepID=A0AAU0UKB6_9FIRM|nr:hypothetical protein MFMK1_000758 [Desulfitibacteraceae bacterium MK1]